MRGKTALKIEHAGVYYLPILVLAVAMGARLSKRPRLFAGSGVYHVPRKLRPTTQAC